jgi:hypothetical protein
MVLAPGQFSSFEAPSGLNSSVFVPLQKLQQPARPMFRSNMST